MRKTNQKGFTIIELLVVIVIIGILVALALPQLFAAQARGRDTERKNDLKNIKTQLETYYNDNDQYPDALSEVDGLTADDLKDPKGASYGYNREGTAGNYQEYTLTANLENKKDKAVTDENRATGLYEVESVNKITASEDED